MQKITPFLWFDDQAEAAANFYVSVFSSRRGGGRRRVRRSRRSPATAMRVPAIPDRSMTVSFQPRGAALHRR